MEKIDFSSFDKQLVELYSKYRTEYEDESFSLGYILMELDSFIVFMSISEIGTLESIHLRSKKLIKILSVILSIQKCTIFSLITLKK
jgi:hypothetical protein